MLIYLLGVILSLLGGYHFTFKVIENHGRVDKPVRRIIVVSAFSWLGVGVYLYSILIVRCEK